MFIDMKKEHIANLFRQMSFFSAKLTHGEFHGEFLVNQIAVDKYKGQQAAIDKPVVIKCPPDRDTLLDLIGKAGMEMKVFMKEMDDHLTLNEKLAQQIRDFDEEFDMTLGSRGSEISPAEKWQIIMGRYKQMADFVNMVASTEEDGTPTKFVKTAHFLNSKISQPLVNQNAKEESPVGSIQLTDTKVIVEGEEVGTATHLQILHSPTESTGGKYSMGIDPGYETKDSEGMAPKNPDQH